MRCDHRPLFSPISTLAMLTLAASASLAACNKGGDLKKPDTGPTGGQTARVNGHVSETISGGAAMQAWRLAGDGTATVLSEGPLESDGTYSLEVPPGEVRAVIAAVDADGNAVGKALIATTGPADSDITAPPIDVETTLEATAYTLILTGGSSAESIDPVEIRLRIDATTAADLSAEDDPDAGASTLATALASAQATELAAYTRADLSLTGDALFQAEMELATAYDASLDAGDDATEAFGTLFDATFAARAGLGVDESTAWLAEARAGLALRLVADSGLRGTATADALLVSSGALEARLANPVALTLAEESGDDTAATLAGDAVETLADATASSPDASTTGRAWGDFRVSLIGPSTSDTVLSAELGDDAAAATLLARTALTSGETLDSGAGLAVSNALAAPGTPAAVADAVDGVWDAFLTEIDTNVTTGLPDATDTTLTTSLLVLAAGSFRAGG